MTAGIFALLGAVLGGGAVWWVQRPRIAFLERELREASDRLLAAWKDGAVVPPRTVSTPKTVVKLSTALQHKIDEWESSETRLHILRKVVALQEKGYGEPAILHILEREHGL